MEPKSSDSPRKPVAYLISLVEGFGDEANLKRFGQVAGPVIQKYGGRFLVSNTDLAVVEGESSLRRLSMVEFPSMEQAKAWYQSLENSEARVIAPLAFKGRLLVLVEGV